jgi:hypothetical protein
MTKKQYKLTTAKMKLLDARQIHHYAPAKKSGRAITLSNVSEL